VARALRRHDGPMKIVLSSSSPRRLALLVGCGYTVETCSPEIDETISPDESPHEATLRLARGKARAAPADSRTPVVAGDTLVILAGRPLGKPRDETDAVSTLEALSGRWHEVASGWCVRCGEMEDSGITVTRVRFRDLEAGEAVDYVKTGEPLGKAGAYGIQGLGGELVATVDGSFSNVIGIPLLPVLRCLDDLRCRLSRA